jgi:glyoxylase I family protein
MHYFAKPFVKRVDHVSWTVADVEAVAKFYVDVFGASEVYRLGPMDAAEMPLDAQGRDWTESHVNVKDGRLRIVMLKLADNLNFELFQYERPRDGAARLPRNCDVGGHHIALKVDDLDAVAAYLADRGCLLMETIDVGGPRARYFQDPWGHQLELTE